MTPVLSRYVFYPLALAAAVYVIIQSHAADRLFHLAAEMQSLAGSSRLAWASLLERLSFSWYSGATELNQAYTHILAQAGAAELRAIRAGLVLCALGFIHVVILRLVTPRARKQLAWHLNLTAAVTLIIGLAAPMLTVIAHINVPVLGNVILRYETKSILSTIADLGSGSNWLLAVLITVFSVLVPLLKLILVGIVSGDVAIYAHQRALKILNGIGKWSMADVFVVAVLVAFLAIKKDPHSSAEIGLGLYFFSLYCGLSMGATYLAASANASFMLSREMPARTEN